jgi:hypothetical protein
VGAGGRPLAPEKGAKLAVNGTKNVRRVAGLLKGDMQSFHGRPRCAGEVIHLDHIPARFSTRFERPQAELGEPLASGPAATLKFPVSHLAHVLAIFVNHLKVSNSSPQPREHVALALPPNVGDFIHIAAGFPRGFV